jgi:CheY-like chemotaxis protein
MQPAALKRLARQVERVLIVDPNVNSARLLGDIMKDLGSISVALCAAVPEALMLVKDNLPQIIFVEYAAMNFDGLALVRTIRRSELLSRQVPIVVTTAEATAQSIKASRDAGVHEFLRKPFTIKDLYRRVEAVTLKSRDWIEAVGYVGPDRRRFNSGDYSGKLRRENDQPSASPRARIGQALKIIKSAVEALESDPFQAARSLQAQASDLQVLGMEIQDFKLAQAAGALHQYLALAAKGGGLNRKTLDLCTKGLLSYLDEQPKVARSGTAA